MRLKIDNVIGMLGLSMTLLAVSLPVESIASGEHVVTDTGASRQLAIRTVSNGIPVYTAYARPAAQDSNTLSVSVVPEVDHWTMLAAILGLISMRLWRSGKKNLLVIK